MTDEEFEKHRTELLEFVAMTHRFAGLVALVTFLGYGISAYILWKGAALGALVLATLSYLLFRSFRGIALWLARRRLGRRAPYVEALKLVERELSAHSPKQVLADIETRAGG